jgi:hypothetical protein
MVRPILIAVCLACLGSPAGAAGPPPTWDGLVLTERKGLDIVYVRPGTEFPGYRTVLLEQPVEVAFDSAFTDASQRGRRPSAADLERIRGDIATEFRKVFAERLGKGGYALVDAVGEDTLRVGVALIDIYINAPDLPAAGRGRTFTVEAGRATIVMELRDGPTGAVLARVIDTRTADSPGRMQVANSVTNSAEFRRLARAWTDRLVKALDTVNAAQEP